MVHASRRCDRSNATMAARVNGVAERRPGRQHGAALARVAILETVMPWRSMCVAMTASVRFRVAPTPPSSAIHADRRAERPSINEKLVAPERTKSNIPAAFLTFLFTRLHADAEPKAKKQEISLCSNCSVWRPVGAEVLVPCRSRVAPTRRADRIRLRVPRLGQFSHTRRDIAMMKMTSAGTPPASDLCCFRLRRGSLRGTARTGAASWVGRPMWHSLLSAAHNIRNIIARERIEEKNDRAAGQARQDRPADPP
jgi:hypothetical protein